MTQKLAENEGKEDTGYYTPKNILNPAMFRLAEITRALSEVNMQIEQEKLFNDRRHTINVEKLRDEDPDRSETENQPEAQLELIEGCKLEKKAGMTDMLKRNEDTIGLTLLISLAISIILLITMLFFWS